MPTPDALVAPLLIPPEKDEMPISPIPTGVAVIELLSSTTMPPAKVAVLPPANGPMFERAPFTMLFVTAIPLRRIDPVLLTSPVTVALEMLIQSIGAELLMPLCTPVMLI